MGAGITMIALLAAWLKYPPHVQVKLPSAAALSVPRVVVSKPLIENRDTRLSFLGQFSAVSQVEIRAHLSKLLNFHQSQTQH
jgi:hypothetical protein